jgi:6-phosphogluconolactonase
MLDNMIKTNSQEEFVNVVCETIKEQADKNIKEKDSFTFVLSGGRTPKAIFEELALNYKKSIEWSKVHFFWLDERCVSPSHKDSNYKLAYDHLISKLADVGSVHRMKGEIDPNQAAKEYKEEILSFFGADEVKFDFVLLGMGEDGHVASLFPDSAEVKKVSDLALATERVYGGYRRITLGLNLINMSMFKLLMVKGEEKMRNLENCDEKLPINKIKDKKVVCI